MITDFAAIMTGEKPAAPKSGTSALADPTMAALATIYAENPRASREEQRAIASALVNRAARDGGTLLDVVQANDGKTWQFEPWNPADKNGRRRLEAFKAGSKEHTALVANVGDILDGSSPPEPYVNFYAPAAQAKLGRPKPKWDDGTGVQVGDHLFFASKGSGDLASIVGAKESPDADAAFAEKFGDPKKFDEGVELTGGGVIPYRDLPGDTLTKPQEAFFAALNKGGGYKPQLPDGSMAPGGTETNPFFLQSGSREKDVPPGAFFVDRAGKVKRAPGGEPIPSSMGQGFSRGIGDVMLSVANMAPGAEDSTLRNRFTTDQAIYDAKLKGDFISGAGRFAGQMAGSLPAMAAAEGIAAPLLTKFGGPVGEFLLGKAGSKALPEGASAVDRVKQILLRGSSLGVSGAQEGAGATLLTSSASDQPLGEQLATGAVLGGVAKPVAKAGFDFFASKFGPKAAGASPVAEQQRLSDLAGSLPVPVGLSVGQLTQSPGAQLVESGILKGVEGDLPARVVQSFKADQQGALRENVQAISDIIARRGITPGEGAQATSETLNAMRDSLKKEVDRAYDAARKAGGDAMLASSRDVRDGVLAGLRERFNLDRVKHVTAEVEALGQNGAPTVRELFDARSRLSQMTQSSDDVEAAAARTAKSAMDGYIASALKNDLFLGDPTAVKAWRTAISKRRDLGRLFEGNDLIEGLTERTQRGGDAALKVDPHEAVNYILGRDAIGFATKQNLTRDLLRLRSVLGPNSDAWNGLRADVFMRLARAGEGAPEGGVAQFSGQKFLKAWNDVNTKNPRLMKGIFTDDERKLISDFAEVAQVATTTVKGGDNSSNSAFAAKKLMDRLGQFLSVGGGASAGAAAGGVPGAAAGALFGGLMKDIREFLAVGKARKLTFGAKPVNNTGLKNKFLTGPAAPAAAAITGNRIIDLQPAQ